MIIKGFTSHVLQHCPDIPVFYVTVEVHGSRIVTTDVMITYDDAYAIGESDEPGMKSCWQYGHARNCEFDEWDMNNKYAPSEEILKYAKRVIEGSDSFKNWGRIQEILSGSDSEED